jgi:hypothetical protein
VPDQLERGRGALPSDLIEFSAANANRLTEPAASHATSTACGAAAIQGRPETKV